MPKLQVAVIGPGRLGLACADALIDESELGLAGFGCACFEGKALEAHHAALGEAADNHRLAAVVAGVSGEYRGDNGASQHPVYVELERGAAF